MKKLDECIQKTAVPTLDILTSGPIPPNPSELLSSEQTVKMLEKLSVNVKPPASTREAQTHV